LGYRDRQLALKARFVSCACACLCAAFGCSKKPEPPHRTEPWLATPSTSAAVTTSAPRSYHFGRDSSVRFSVSGRKGGISGRAPVTDGGLRLDPRDLKTASASVVVDLTQLAMDAEGLPAAFEGSGSSPNAMALDWLELGAQVAAEKRAQLGTARFELASVENATTLELGASRKPRPVRATAVGTLLIHGFRAPVRAEVLLVAVAGPTAAPPRIAIRTTSALVVPLGPHDIFARAADGTPDVLATARAADWVGKSVRLEIELTAEPDP
jgi:hypothetical protein